MNTGLYFGSFNPLHIGHITICKYLLDNTDLDELRLVVSPLNPLKDSEYALNAKERLNNVTEAIKKAGFGKRVVVSDFEFSLPTPLYTINTLRKFKELEPERSFILVIGADNLAIIEKWHKWEELLSENTVWVYPRGGFDAQALCQKYGCKALSAPLIDISSTQIREAEKSGIDMSAYRL
ncbi:MAG: nicotinate (nicotinamide) nucleotide adenylyltransferase [Bacteroidetes bacterium HGW-Bacteroidetes-8]|jgi:nicotinate-nucleotide adenylyltransferase|nr:MAG: nicotinate (nicotinamide) nucleotide adenylyltransferase [Bacteroidetes bacterium HGW-Bacteroidetes-8]